MAYLRNTFLNIFGFMSGRGEKAHFPPYSFSETVRFGDLFLSN